jgi:hypothetical protein
MNLKFWVILIFISSKVLAQSLKINGLLSERRALYTEWKQALDQKSGIFGNQTKADLEEVNEILKKIIKKDNEIVEVLEATKDNDYQALAEKYNQIIEENRQLTHQKEALEKKLAKEKAYQKTNHSQIQRSEGDKMLMGLIALFSILVLIYMVLKMRSANKKMKALEAIIKNSTR